MYIDKCLIHVIGQNKWPCIVNCNSVILLSSLSSLKWLKNEMKIVKTLQNIDSFSKETYLKLHLIQGRDFISGSVAPLTISVVKVVPWPSFGFLLVHSAMNKTLQRNSCSLYLSSHSHIQDNCIHRFCMFCVLFFKSKSIKPRLVHPWPSSADFTKKMFSSFIV